MAGRVLWATDSLCYSIGKQTLFDQAELSIHEGERLALIGRNGCGKSTFMKIVAGLDAPSTGDIRRGRDVQIAYLPQDIDIPGNPTVGDYVREALCLWTQRVALYEKSDLRSSEHEQLEKLLTAHDAWYLEPKVATVSNALNLPAHDRRCDTLSGGEKRRVTLARALLFEPDLLLLDEPTNHLDISAVEWIENFLGHFKGTCLFVTHDRYFLDRIATRIVEIDHGHFFSYSGAYADYLEGKAEREYAEDCQEQRRQKFLRSEINWVRKSPKARLRRNLGRLKNYYRIADQDAPERTGQIELIIAPPPRLGNKVLELEKVNVALNHRMLVQDFSFEFHAGQKIGIIGPNGIGKTTLLRVLFGQLPPNSGKIDCAPTVEFNYIDQNKLALDPEKSVYQEIGEGLDYVMLGSEKVTIWSYLKRFLFEDERIKTQIKDLSGGEKSRIMLAKILKQGGNFLLLDEPTNDLDLSSLQLLEEALMHFDGCMAVVSHDRYFLNRICSGILGFESDGRLVYHVGDYDNYHEKVAPLREQLRRNEREQLRSEKPAPAAPAPTRTEKKLSYKETQELETMEARIAEAEQKVRDYEALFADPDYFVRYGARSAELQTEFAAAQALVTALYTRWDELETRKANLSK